jgi:hypothetical protein
MTGRRRPNPTTFNPSLLRRSLSAADITALQYRLLVELCEHSQIDKPTVKVSNVRLANHCGCTEEAVRQNLNKLQSAGFIQSVGKRQGGNAGANRWRLVYTGMRTRPDTGQPTWDTQGFDRDVFVDSPACHGCGLPQPPTPVGQPPTQTPPTPNADPSNPQPALGLSSYEVERSNYFEVDATACAATRSPNGGAPRFGDAPDKKSIPIPINDEFIGNYQATPIPWPEWIEAEEDLRGEPVPLLRPEGSELADRIAKNCWDGLRDDWEEAHAETSQAIRSCPYGCADSVIGGTFTHTDGTLWWCHHEAPWPAQVDDFLASAVEGRLRAARRAAATR